MLSGVRDHTLALACVRHGLPSDHGRGADQLPGGLLAQFEGSLVRQLNAAELRRAFRVVVPMLLNEIRIVDSGLAARLEEPLSSLAEIEG